MKDQTVRTLSTIGLILGIVMVAIAPAGATAGDSFTMVALAMPILVFSLLGLGAHRRKIKPPVSSSPNHITPDDLLAQPEPWTYYREKFWEAGAFFGWVGMEYPHRWFNGISAAQPNHSVLVLGPSQRGKT